MQILLSAWIHLDMIPGRCGDTWLPMSLAHSEAAYLQLIRNVLVPVVLLLDTRGAQDSVRKGQLQLGDE